ncbi:MAG: tRNA modification GTPase trmE [Acidobacteria bacterium]|nr:tRNA modification GTPase trmE [Acidobacteriota bacterium]
MDNLLETICALSTAPGRSGIALVRVSGLESFTILKKVFLPQKGDHPLAPRHATLGTIIDPVSGAELDEGLVTCFPAPNSYSGEDVVEISLHGSPVLVAALLEGLCCKGARLAEPGEFTLRGFLHGRMDLTQAEAVRDIIGASTLFQAQIAARQRSGTLARRLAEVKKSLIDVVVQLESAVEFVEDDLALESRETLADRLSGIQGKLRTWLESFRRGHVIHDGFSMAIIGRPNVGKSSLFNALLAQERSIVTEFPGTTRDLVSEVTSLEGIPVRLLDTAGIQKSGDPVEQLGVDRSYSAMADADAILLVVDISQGVTAEDEHLKESLGELSCMVVMNKADLPCAWAPDQKREYAAGRPGVEVSAKTGLGIQDLRSTIMKHLFGEPGLERDGVLVTNLRHYQCIQAAERRLETAAAALREGLSEEFVLFDLNGALKNLGAITGEVDAEDILQEIFSRFCIGK